MDTTKCWKCDKSLVEGGCPSCDASMVDLIKESIDRAKERTDSMGDALTSFKEKIKSYKDKAVIRNGTKDIGFAINTLCNIIDLLGEGNSHLISFDDLDEVHEKTQQIIACVESLRKFKLG